MSGILWFLIIWCIGPTLLRLLAIYQTIGQPSGPLHPWLGTVGILLLALPQDLFIASEIMALALAINAFWRFTRLRIWRILSGLSIGFIFFIVHFYLLFDCLLFCKTGIRMRPAFFDYLFSVDCFLDSAREKGMVLFFIGLAALALIAAGAAWQWTRCFSSQRISAWHPLAIMVFGVLAFSAGILLPAQTRYDADNLLMSSETWMAKAIISPSSPLKEFDEKEAVALLSPKAERWRPLSPRFPMKKWTEGFFGEKQFEIDIRSGERPHLVLLFMESFRGIDVGSLGGKYPVSPKFDELSKKGVLFKNFYSCSIQSSRSVLASLFGIPPWMSENSPQETNLTTPFIGIADMLNQRGYKSAYFTGTTMHFERGKEYFTNHGYSETIGEQEISRAFPRAKATSWGCFDEDLMNYAADWLQKNDRLGQPSFLTIHTVTHHHPWEVPDGFQTPVFDTGENEEYGRFLQTFYYSDHCLGLFMDRLRATGLAAKTIVLVLGDHGCSQHDHEKTCSLANSLYDENVKIPFIILAKGRIKKPAIITDVGSQIDILPTIMDLFDIQGPNYSVGTSLVRKVPNRTAYFINPFGLQYEGMRRGNMKYIFTLASHESSIYDLDADPGEKNDLADPLQDLVKQCHKEVNAYNNYVLKLFLTGRMIEP
jgi:phosphoglycerol transferase MdoB-like AlkP superfamily enzyme